MGKQKESSEVVKDRIVNVAAELFAKYGVSHVGIRRIADEAGINHALIIRYFETKENLMTEILHQQIAGLTGTYPKPGQPPVKTLANMRELLLGALNDDENTMKLIVRASLDGLAPESFVDANQDRAAKLIAKWIASQQAGQNLPDAKLVSMVMVAAMFSMVSIAPWLMTAVGLPSNDFEKRKDDIMDVMIWLIARAIGLPTDADENRKDVK